MLDHVTIGVTHLDRAIRFYDATPAPLGIRLLFTVPGEFAGFGDADRPWFWIGARPRMRDGSHIAFAAPDRAAVSAFHAAALAAGGRDNGAPGLRPQYDPDYFGAFVLDPDGHNIEAVCRTPA